VSTQSAALFTTCHRQRIDQAHRIGTVGTDKVRFAGGCRNAAAVVAAGDDDGYRVAGEGGYCYDRGHADSCGTGVDGGSLACCRVCFLVCCPARGDHNHNPYP